MGRILAVFAGLLIRALAWSWRVRLTGAPPEVTGPPLVFCFWHGEQPALFAHPRPRPVTALVSRSRDGALQARILAGLGLRVRRGSSSRGGAAGLKGIIEEMRNGADAAFAVDGPRGPRHKAKPGAVLAAKALGTHLIPLTVTASRAWIFEQAWDRYALPCPFAEVVIHRGAPIPSDGDAAAVTHALQAALLSGDGPDLAPARKPRGSQ